MVQAQLAVPSIPAQLVHNWGAKPFLTRDFLSGMTVSTPAQVVNPAVVMDTKSYQAAVLSVADYALHMSVNVPTHGALELTWQPVSGVLFARNQNHMFELGWPGLPTFGYAEFDNAFSWLRSHGYLQTESVHFERSGTYLPTPKLIWAFAQNLGIKPV